MPKNIVFEDLGLMDYQQAWDYQELLFQQLLSSKGKSTAGSTANAGNLLFVEHPHVYTLGKSGSPENLLVNEAFLQSKGASFYHINRGGDITYHGPGQLVGYPILDLDALCIGVREYVFRLEEVVIQCLKQYNIEGGRLGGASGVWLGADITGLSRKICAIGVRASRAVTMHGFAFNINTDLSFYNHINPCGFTDKGVTSLQMETGTGMDMKLLKNRMKVAFEAVFDVKLLT